LFSAGILAGSTQNCPRFFLGPAPAGLADIPASFTMDDLEALQDGEMEDALRKTQEMLMEYQSLHELKEKMAQRVSAEENAHAKTQDMLRTQSEKLTTLCAEREDLFEALRRERLAGDKARRDHEMEATTHAATRSEAKAQLDGERSAHEATREALQRELATVQKSAGDQLLQLQQENEMLRAQMQSYENRCATTEARLADVEKDNERLHQAHALTKSSLQSALQAQEAYRKEYHATHQELQAVRAELQATRDELSQRELSQPMVRTDLQTQEEVAHLRNELEAVTRLHQETKIQMDSCLQETRNAEQNVAMANQALREREEQLNKTKVELENTKAKAKEICNLVKQASPRRC